MFFALRPKAPPTPQPWALSEPLVVPPPPADLLATQSQAQAQTVDGEVAALAVLEQDMRAYRAQWRGMPAFVAQKHAAADRLMDQGQAVEAARALASIVETSPTTPSGPLADSRRILLQDAYFRLCRLALSEGQAIVAALQTHHALALGESTNDPFVVNLLLVRAVASERAGDTGIAQADRDRLRALAPKRSATPGRRPARRTRGRARSRRPAAGAGWRGRRAARSRCARTGGR